MTKPVEAALYVPEHISVRHGPRAEESRSRGTLRQSGLNGDQRFDQSGESFVPDDR